MSRRPLGIRLRRKRRDAALPHERALLHAADAHQRGVVRDRQRQRRQARRAGDGDRHGVRSSAHGHLAGGRDADPGRRRLRCGRCGCGWRGRHSGVGAAAATAAAGVIGGGTAVAGVTVTGTGAAVVPGIAELPGGITGLGPLPAGSTGSAGGRIDDDAAVSPRPAAVAGAAARRRHGGGHRPGGRQRQVALRADVNRRQVRAVNSCVRMIRGVSSMTMSVCRICVSLLPNSCCAPASARVPGNPAAHAARPRATIRPAGSIRHRAIAMPS